MATNTIASSVPPLVPVHTDPTDATMPLPGVFNTQYLNGNGTIRGWVRNSSGVPQLRQMVLLVEPSMQALARTRTRTADPQETDYEFKHLADLTGTGERYAVVQRPEDFATAAQIRNGLLAAPPAG